jgi:hypothetical protein
MQGLTGEEFLGERLRKRIGYLNAASINAIVLREPPRFRVVAGMWRVGGFAPADGKE